MTINEVNAARNKRRRTGPPTRVSDGGFAADVHQLFHQDGAITKFAGFLPVRPTFGINIDIMVLREGGLAIVEIIRCYRSADINPFITGNNASPNSTII